MPTIIISDNTSGSTHSGTEDTRLGSVSGGTTNYGSETTFQVQNSSSTDKSTALLRFTLPAALSGATVSAVRLRLYQTDGGSASAWPLDMYEALRAWVESQATWNIWSTGNNWATAGGIGSGDIGTTVLATLSPDTGAGVWREFSGSGLTALLQAKASAGATQVDLFIRPQDLTTTSGPYVVFRSSEGTDGQRPTLEIDYTGGGGGGSSGGAAVNYYRNLLGA